MSLLWILDDPKRLGTRARAELEDGANEVSFSAASIWEIAIKAALKRSDFRFDAVEITHKAREAGLAELPVTASDASQISKLPQHHRDPFDRLLIAQAQARSLLLYTADRTLGLYSDQVVLVP